MHTVFYQRTRTLLLTLLWLGPVASVLAQLVTTIPAFPTADKEVTIIVDLKQAKDGRAAGLLGKKDDIFF